MTTATLAGLDLERATWCSTRGCYADDLCHGAGHVHYDIEYDGTSGRVLTSREEQTRRAALAQVQRLLAHLGRTATWRYVGRPEHLVATLSVTDAHGTDVIGASDLERGETERDRVFLVGHYRPWTDPEAGRCDEWTDFLTAPQVARHFGLPGRARGTRR